MGEMQKMQSGASEKWSAAPIDESDLFKWVATVNGPAGTAYAGGRFLVNVVFPSDYPFKPMEITFKTKMYHPNVNSSGGLCLDIIKNAWSPARTLAKVLDALHDLLITPNCDDPLDAAAAAEYVSDRAGFDVKAAEFVRKYAE
eukprot:c32199_g1_i1.p1 GENE.c32199_g1_i1~~c32199_g1_i1.p1  ORF type:complete len:165 (+),score=36.96 c32199_g1_i1:68-496(+)